MSKISSRVVRIKNQHIKCMTANEQDQHRSLIYLNKTIPKAHTITEVVSPCQMSIQRCRVELGENVHFIDPTVDAIAHRHIDQPICTSYRHLQKESSKWKSWFQIQTITCLQRIHIENTEPFALMHSLMKIDFNLPIQLHPLVVHKRWSIGVNVGASNSQFAAPRVKDYLQLVLPYAW